MTTHSIIFLGPDQGIDDAVNPAMVYHTSAMPAEVQNGHVFLTLRDGRYSPVHFGGYGEPDCPCPDYILASDGTAFQFMATNENGLPLFTEVPRAQVPGTPEYWAKNLPTSGEAIWVGPNIATNSSVHDVAPASGTKADILKRPWRILGADESGVLVAHPRNVMEIGAILISSDLGFLRLNEEGELVEILAVAVPPYEKEWEMEWRQNPGPDCEWKA